MRSNIAVLFATLALLGTALPAFAGKADPLYNPEPMQLVGDKSLENVRKAILRAAQARDWTAQNVSGSHVRATYKKPGKVGTVYIATVDITFNAKTINIRYHSSRDLNYDKDAGTIDDDYNSWVKKLEKRIWKEVNR